MLQTMSTAEATDSGAFLPSGDQRAASGGPGPAAAPPHPLFEALVDTAGAFPPASLAMADALRLHVRAAGGRYGELFGRLLCAASRLDELVEAARAELGAGDDIAVALVCDTGTDGVAAALATLESEPRLILASVEIALPGGAADEEAVAAVVDALPAVEGYIEVPRGGWEPVLPLLADSPYGAKLRTGGPAAEAFPSERDVARFLEACVVEELPFKCTAGLHNAVRHRDPETGFEHHGFLNLLLAAEAATHGESLDRVERIVAEQDGAALARRVAAMDVTDAVVTRSFFAAYGSCSVDEPVADLVALGLLAG